MIARFIRLFKDYTSMEDRPGTLNCRTLASLLLKRVHYIPRSSKVILTNKPFYVHTLSLKCRNVIIKPIEYHVHFDPLNLDAPRCGGLVQISLQRKAVLKNVWDNILWNYGETCMDPDMLSLSLRISCRFLVPNMFRRVVWARSRVEWWAFSTLATETVAFETL